MHGTERVSFTIREAAASVGVSERSLRRAIAGGQLTGRKIGSRLVIPRTDLEEFVRSSPAARLTAK